MSRSPLQALLLALACAAALRAQDARGRILGRVTDSSSAVVPSATVTVTEIDRNTREIAKTNDAGNYDLQYLLPGVYRLNVEANGFKSYVRQPIEVRAVMSAPDPQM